MKSIDGHTKRTEKELLIECLGIRDLWTIGSPNIIETKKKLLKILQSYPQSPTIYFHLGLIELENNPISANFYFDKALLYEPNLEQAWYYKGLIHIIKHEFKSALGCFDKVLTINSKNYRAQNFKLDVLFYLQKFDELESYYLKLFKLRMDDIDFLKNEMVCTNEGLIFGKIEDVLKNEIIIRKILLIELKNCTGIDVIRLSIPKEKIMTLGEMIMLNVTSKLDFLDALPMDKEPPLVMDTHGYLIGELKKRDGEDLVIDIGEVSEVRYFNLLDRNRIKIPRSGILAQKKGILIYDIKKLNPKDILKNSDALKFFQRVFKFTDPFNRYLHLFNNEQKYPYPVKS